MDLPSWLHRRPRAPHRPPPLTPDTRDIEHERAVIEWQRQVLCQQHGVPVDETGAPLNGRCSS